MLLGEKQWAWLEEQFGIPADLRLICSGSQIIPDQKGMDEWACFPADRQRLVRIDWEESLLSMEMIDRHGQVRTSHQIKIEPE